MLDFHNHLVPGVDDGATDLAQARKALEVMREEGVRAIVVTPHLEGALTLFPDRLGARLAEIDAGWEELRALASAEFPELRLERGAEVMLDAPGITLADPRTRLAGTSFVLVEFASMTVPPRSVDALFELRMSGWNPVVAHPERYSNPGGGIDVMAEWRRSGALLQVNAGSLLGRYGSDAEATAWELLKRGWADYLSSDYHARGRLSLRECRAALLRAGGGRQAELLTETNPQRLLAGKAPLPVPPLAGRRSPFWRRLLPGAR
ncbi:MAG TPA: CpsB/CapC family capsule biosynthesis tyrosine phosphatase [Longimicrobiaceae bacterium]|nr:CpsB/CapC family capsule biosynthesis tyrosine phosphatase [Longimicrobiaceae bacterium]